MTVFDELKARGLLAQLTDEEEIKELINNGKATFYIGFDPTADSLHVGHFMALCLMKRMQMAGNKPIALIGGGTGMVGLTGVSLFCLVSGGYLFSRAVTSQVSSAYKGLTSVFGMRTGGSP